MTAPDPLAIRSGLAFTLLAKAAEKARLARSRAKSWEERSCPPSGLTSTLDNRAADWVAPNWPILEVDVGSRMTPTRVTLGAISLSSPSHFAPSRSAAAFRGMSAMPPLSSGAKCLTRSDISRRSNSSFRRSEWSRSPFRVAGRSGQFSMMERMSRLKAGREQAAHALGKCASGRKGGYVTLPYSPTTIPSHRNPAFAAPQRPQRNHGRHAQWTQAPSARCTCGSKSGHKAPARTRRGPWLGSATRAGRSCCR